MKTVHISERRPFSKSEKEQMTEDWMETTLQRTRMIRGGKSNRSDSHFLWILTFQKSSERRWTHTIEQT